MPGELVDTGGNREPFLGGGHARETLPATNALGQILIEAGPEPGLGIEEFKLGRRAALGEPDDAFGFRREVR